ncbi:MAG TPA: ribose-phosphate diphosphokinase [Sphingomicrobium sp.]|nr:ribose-phosphate diphosphokinase [Sphingomicrobium sp.]
MDPLIFALGASRPFGERMAAHLGWTLADVEEREFDGGEHKARPLVEVGGRDVFVVHSLYGELGSSANDKLVRLLFFVGALRDSGAARVTAVAPYLAYTRKDRRTKPRDPVNTRNVALLFDAMRTDAIVTVEVHNVSAFENAFRACRPEHVPIARVLADHLSASLEDGPLAVVSPDVGGVKRAELLRHELERRVGRSVEKALVEKHRSAGVVSGTLFSGDVNGATAIVVDDLISSGTTLARAAAACREHGARKVIAAAAHGLFTGGAPALFSLDGPDEVIVTDTVPLPRDLAAEAAGKVRIVPVGELVADVVGRMHRGKAVSDLIPYD